MYAIRTLLADGSTEFADSAARFLSLIPQVSLVGQAHSSREALKMICDLAPDLVLMDLALSKMNGLEVTQHIKATDNPPLVVVLGLHDNAHYRKAAHQVGADGFVAKSDFGCDFPALLKRLVSTPALAK